MGGRTILISPLNWGFGHAGRMIPLALELKRRGNDVVFGADAQLLPLLENELPGIRLIEIPGLRIRYSVFLPQWLCIFMQLPVVVLNAFREHFALRKIAGEVKPSVIISDNRFGFFHREIFSVYVTHQLRIPFPRGLSFMEPFAARLHRKITGRYDLCLVPDWPGPVNFSGRLSHGLKLPGNVHYMGPLSRFMMTVPSEAAPALRHPYCCLILSGPEPQRTVLLEKVCVALHGFQLCVLSAAPVQTAMKENEAIDFFIKPDAGTMRRLIEGSSLVITRSGYTSVMELTSLGKGAILIPTPGQPEQEYLGEYLGGRYGFITLGQQHIGRLRALAEEKMTGAALTEPPPCQFSETASPAENSAPQFSDGAWMFEQAVNLLPDQKKE
ncbi:MAG: glycosyltransferase [Bacteroidales bacterium]